MKPTVAVTRLAALAQESRLAIYRMLVRHGPQGLCVSDIASGLDLAPATLSFHLKELTNAGLLSARQEGRFIYYAPDFHAMTQLLSYLTENCCGAAVELTPCSPARARRVAR